MTDIKWAEYPKMTQTISEGTLAIVNLPVEVVFMWSDKIVSYYDEDTEVYEYTSGYVMHVVGSPKFVYKDHSVTIMGSVAIEK